MASVRVVPSPISDTETKVRGVVQEFARAFNEGDWEVLKSLYVTDAVVLPPHQRLAPGIPAICELHKWLREGGEANLKIEVIRIIESNELAVLLGTYTIQGRSLDGTAYMDRGKEFSVLQRQPNGEYRFLVQGWSSDLPPVMFAR